MSAIVRTTRAFRSIRCLTSSSSSSSVHDHAEQQPHNPHAVKNIPPPISFPHPPPMKPFAITPRRTVPSHISKPPYASTGIVPPSMYPENTVLLHDDHSIRKMRQAAVLARRALDHVCRLVHVSITTDELDRAVHDFICDGSSNNNIEGAAYPSPLNYAGFPKSLCASINEVICHGIPNVRPLEFGDVLSLDVSCYLNGVHGDNCATVIVGDTEERSADKNGTQNANDMECDWRGVPMLQSFSSPDDEARIKAARRLVQATQEGLAAGIDACRRMPSSTSHERCLSNIGAAIHSVADAYGYDTVRKYRGHGIAQDFHCPPFVKHYRNNDKLPLRPGMIFTIEPMFTEGAWDCREWDDDWTVVTLDGGFAAQFEHTVLITDTGVEILTLPE